MPKQRKSQPSVQINDLIIEETALELALSKALVKEVVSAQSDFTIERIREGGFEGTMWPLFGKIMVKVSKVKFLHDLLGKSDIKKNTSSPQS